MHLPHNTDAQLGQASLMFILVTIGHWFTQGLVQGRSCSNERVSSSVLHAHADGLSWILDLRKAGVSQQKNGNVTLAHAQCCCDVLKLSMVLKCTPTEFNVGRVAIRGRRY
jgi:hypothetical protein